MTTTTSPLSTRTGAVRARLRAAGRYAAAVAHAALIFGFIRPATRVLPMHTARRVPTVLGWAWSVTPKGRRLVRSLVQAFPDGPHDPQATARAILGEPYRQYVISRQVLRDDDAVAGVGRVTMRMTDRTRDLMAGDQSFVLAVGHFSREAAFSVTRGGVTPRTLLVVAAPKPVKRPSLNEAAQHEMFETVKRAAIKGHESTVMTRGERTVDDIIGFLRGPGRAVHIHVDAVLPRASTRSLSRPFAGASQRHFATGAARMARLAQVPVLLCEAEPDGRGGTLVRWSDPIGPPPVDDETADSGITSRLLDEIERDIARRPGQYVQAIGNERHWDPVGGAWYG